MPCFKTNKVGERKGLEEFGVSVFAILVQEFNRRPMAERQQHLNVLVALYVYLRNFLSPEGEVAILYVAVS